MDENYNGKRSKELAIVWAGIGRVYVKCDAVKNVATFSCHGQSAFGFSSESIMTDGSGGLDQFCNSSFWDYELSWNTSSPDLTICFERTVLVWVPCGFLWLFLLLEISYLHRSLDRLIPWSWINVSKMITSLLLLILECVNFFYTVQQDSSGEPVPDVNYLTPCIIFFTILVQLVLVMLEKKRGMQSSPILFFFWFLLMVCGIAEFQTLLRQDSEQRSDYENVLFITYMIYFPLVVIMFFLNCFGDATPKYINHPRGERPNPEVSSSFLSLLTFAWLDQLVWQGYRKPLTQDTMWNLSHDNCANTIVSIWDKHWQRSFNKKGRRQPRSPSPTAHANYSNNVVHVQPHDTPTAPIKPISVLPTMIKTFGWQFLFGASLKLVHDIVQFVSPLLLSRLIEFTESIDTDVVEPVWRGYFYALLMFLAAQFQSFILAQYFKRMYVIGLHMRTGVISAVYRKALLISNAARKDSTVGEIVNLMSVDAQRFMDLMAYFNMLWSAPLQIIIALYLLYDKLGASVASGVVVMVVLIPINGFIASRTKTLQISQMKSKDQRVKLMNEILNGIKVLKLYAWEPSFEEQVLGVRSKEIKVLKKAAYLNAGTSFIWSCTPFLVVFASLSTYVIANPEVVLTAEKIFVSIALLNILRMPLGLTPIIVAYTVQVVFASLATFVLVNPGAVLTAEKMFVSITLLNILSMPLGLTPIILAYTVQVSLVTFATYINIEDTNILNSNKAFVSISLFNLLRFPIAMLPMLISNLIQASVSLKRLNKFLNADELDPTSVSHDASEEHPVVVEKGTFAWGYGEGEEGRPILENINLKVKPGALVAVVGTVGAGKSSLCSAILGEMEKLEGKVNVKGSIAYVAQQAWIQNATLENNILFGHAKENDRYNSCIRSCALASDLEMLPGGDQTEIGEKGINLSGGQKQRVSLARAVYSDADIYLLDDPLSAVDAHVGKHIFQQVIGPQGILKNKSRVLVTHGITYLPRVDYILVLKNGKVSESGTYAELVEKKGEFQEFLLQYLSEKEEDDSVEELEDIKHQLESKIGREALQRQISRKRQESESESMDGEKTGSLKRVKRISESEKDSLKQPKRISESEKGQDGIILPAGGKEPKVGQKLVEAEKAETGKVSFQVYGYYLRAVGVLASVMTIIFYVLAQGCSVGSNLWLSKWSESYGPNGTMPDEDRNMYLGVYASFGVGQAGFILGGAFCLSFGALDAAEGLHRHILRQVLRFPMAFFDTNPLGRIINRFGKDIDTMDNVLPWSIRSWLVCFVTVLATFIVIMAATIEFTAVMVPAMVIYYFVQTLYVATSRQLKRIESVSRSPIYSHFGETIQGAPTIRAYDRQHQFIHESETKVDNNLISSHPSIMANRWLAVRLEFIGNIMTFSAAMFAVAYRGNISGGIVGLSVSYALSVTQTLNWLVRMTSDVETNIVAVERIKEYTETPQEAAWEVPNKKPPKEWPEKGVVKFDKYSTRYRTGLDLVVKDITCNIDMGEKVGIVGRTGAGKSSLTLGLFRIIEPAGGQISIDSVNIAEIGLHDLRSRLTIIPQDPVLFSGTLRMNLDPFNMYSDEKVWQALEQSHLKEFVASLTTRLQFEVAEGGDNLSVGQRQLVCLARALLRKTRVLILDEATAAVDLETDDLIQDTIRQEFADCTVITIAHRLNTIMDSNRVLVLSRGEVKEFDSPVALLKNKSSIFYGMAKDAGLV
ncbi:hypothetical protein Pcinc_034255 [Petrolisthes cinctipes]|uniref:ABC-type glutathione-S-conjugate transporter n=1 Tax=Petrolisthes cinctipes TaxID=88211 RepID=A0AAE1JVY2_PETCI|nr:hypothetical protein Pcinc_034255 [Petrolisthes cinctipes]